MKYLLIVNKLDVPIDQLEFLKNLGFVIICINEFRPYWEGYSHYLYIDNAHGMSKIRDALIRSGLSDLLGHYCMAFSPILEIDHVIPTTTLDYTKYILKFTKIINSIDKIAQGSTETLDYSLLN